MAISTILSFPHSYLPMPQRTGLGYQPVSPLLRTQLTSGRARQRRLYTSTPTQVGVTWIFNEEQSQLFEAWFRDVISDGAAWFNMRIRAPIGIDDYACRFMDIYEGPTLIGFQRWQFTANLELWERPILPPGWGEFPDLVANQSIIDLAMNREWPEA